MLMYIACLCPNLVSVHFYAIPILHFKFPKFFIYLFSVGGPREMRAKHTVAKGARDVGACTPRKFFEF